MLYRKVFDHAVTRGTVDVHTVSRAEMPVVVKENIAGHKASDITDLNAVADGISHGQTCQHNAINVCKTHQLALEKLGAIGVIKSVAGFVFSVKTHSVAITVPDAADDLDVLVSSATGKMLIFNKSAA